MQGDKFQSLDAVPLLDIHDVFSNDKTIREVACDICNIVLKRLNRRFYDDQVDICAFFGFFDWLDTLKLKGAAGFQPYGMQREKIKVGEGIIGRVAQEKKHYITNDLQNDPQKGNEVERVLTKLADQVALLTYPLLLPNGQLVGVLVLGKFSLSSVSNSFFRLRGFNETIDKLAQHIAIVYYYATLVVKGKLARKYLENERHFTKTATQFYGKSTLEMDPQKFMELIALESMKLLNAGNPANPFYTNLSFL